MRHKLSVVLAVALCALLTVSAISSVAAAGKYVLAYVREMGPTEIGGQPYGSTRKLLIRVFNEDGTPKSGATAYHYRPGTTGMGTWGATDASGLFNISAAGGLQMPNGTQMTFSVVNDGTPPTNTNVPESDVSPYMTTHRYRNSINYGSDENWYHCGYELGYLYKADAANPGTFDNGTVDGLYNGTWNTDANSTDSPKTAPYSKSLAYNSINFADSSSDVEYQGVTDTTGKGSFGQTFEANGDRVMAIQVKTVVAFTFSSFRLNCQVFECDGGNNPTSTPVSDIKRIAKVSGNVVTTTFTFGVNDCPVVPGHKYYYKIWSDNTGIQAYGVGDVYNKGQAYVNGSPVANRDLKGFVCCMNYGTTNLGNIGGTIKDNNGVALPSALVTLSQASTPIKSVYTGIDGKYIFRNLPTGNYTIDVKRALNADGAGAATVVAPTGTYPNVALQTTTLDITCNALTNLVQNSGFETIPAENSPTYGNPLVSPWTQAVASFYWCGATAKYPHEGFGEAAFNGSSVYAGGSMQGNPDKSGMGYQVVNGLTIGKTYIASSFIRTNYHPEWNLHPENPGGEEIDRISCKLGIDPAGGTDFSAATWSDAKFPFYEWQFVTQEFVATATSATIYLSYDIAGAQGGAWTFAQFDDVGICEKTTVPPPAGAVAEALKKADNTPVYLPGMYVTAGYSGLVPTFTNAIYVEDMNRSAGIRINTTNAVTHPSANNPFYAGDYVTVAGTMATNSEGEREINATDLTAVTGTDVIDPLFLTNRDLGGSNLNTYTLGVYQGKGLYNVGKLATIFGKVTATGSGFFYVDDGSNLNDGSGVPGAKGIRVDSTGFSNPTTSNYVFVTGIVTLKKIGSPTPQVRPVLRPIEDSSFVTY